MSAQPIAVPPGGSGNRNARVGAKTPKANAIFVHKYLVFYNMASCLLWAMVLLRFTVLYPLVGYEFVAEGVDDFLRWVQTLMILDVVHSAIGLVRSPVMTTAMQIASRLLVVWGVLYPFPEVGQSFAFSTCTVAWCITEIIRYLFYTLTLMRGSQGVPKWLVWIRYSAFYILYPLGAGSEWVLVLLSVPEAEIFSTLYALILKVTLLIYIPGFYVMFTHVMRQRKKALSSVKVASEALENKKRV